MLSQCKYSGTGQNGTKLPCILFCKGTYFPGDFWAENWNLSYYFVPEQPKSKMGHGFFSNLLGFPYIPIDKDSGDFIFTVSSRKDKVKDQEGLYEERQKSDKEQ